MDNLGNTIAQFSAIESLNKQYLDLSKYLLAKKNPIQIKDFTKSVYKMTNKLKKIAGEGVVGQRNMEDLMSKQMNKIIDRTTSLNLDPSAFIKYYHTMALSPFTGVINKRGYPLTRHYQSIHGSKLIPQVTRRAYYEKYESFVNKLEDSWNKKNAPLIDKEGVQRADVRLKEAFKKSTQDLKTFKHETLLKQIEIPFKESVKAKPQEHTLDKLALNNRDLAEVKKFSKMLKENPAIEDNFNGWFGHFTTMYGDMLPRSPKEMTIKDVYAINRFFNKMGDPTDLSFHVKHFLHDPRWVDQYLVSKGIAKKANTLMVKNPKTGKMVEVANIVSPIAAISNYSKNVKDKGTDIDTIKLKKKHEKLFKYIQELPDKDAAVRELIDWRENNQQGVLSSQSQKLNKMVTEFFESIGNNFIYVKDNKGNRYTDKEGNWSLDKNFIQFYKDTKGKLNKYIHYDKNGRFNFNHFFNKVIDIDLNQKNISNIRKEVGVDGVKRYLYELRLERQLNNKKFKSDKDLKAFILDYRKKHPFKGIGFFEPSEYIPHMNFGKTESTRRAFVESVQQEAQRKYREVLQKTGSKAKAEQVRKAYLRQMEDVSNFSAEFMTIKDIAELGEVNESILDKTLDGLGLKTRIGPLEGREVNLQGYDKTHIIFNDYIDKVVNGYYKTMSAIHGDKQIMDMREQLSKRSIPEAEKQYFKKLYQQGEKRKSRRKEDIPLKEKSIELGGRKPRYKDYGDVWADYIKLHLQTVLGHQTYFPEQIMYEVNRKIDPLFLKDKRNLFYLSSDQNMMQLYEKLYQKKKFSNALR